MTGSEALSTTAHSSSPSTHCREQPRGRMGGARQFEMWPSGQDPDRKGEGAHSGCLEALVPPGDPGDTSRPCVGTGCPICLLTPGPDQDSHLFEGKVNATGVLPNPTPPAPRRGEQILQDPCQFTRKADDLRQATQETGCVWRWSQRFSRWEKQPPTMP